MIPDNFNLTEERPSFVTHLECSLTGERYDADTLHNLSRAGSRFSCVTTSPGSAAR